MAQKVAKQQDAQYSAPILVENNSVEPEQFTTDEYYNEDTFLLNSPSSFFTYLIYSIVNIQTLASNTEFCVLELHTNSNNNKNYRVYLQRGTLVDFLDFLISSSKTWMQFRPMLLEIKYKT